MVKVGSYKRDYTTKERKKMAPKSNMKKMAEKLQSMVMEDFAEFCKSKDDNERVLELIKEFSDINITKKSKKDGEPSKKTFWASYLKMRSEELKAEQDSLSEGDDGWIEKERGWNMKIISEEWKSFKKEHPVIFAHLEKKYKQDGIELDKCIHFYSSITLDESSDDSSSDSDEDEKKKEAEKKKKEAEKKKKEAEKKKKEAEKKKKEAEKKKEETNSNDSDSDSDSDSDDDSGDEGLKVLTISNDSDSDEE